MNGIYWLDFCKRGKIKRQSLWIQIWRSLPEDFSIEESLG